MIDHTYNEHAGTLLCVDRLPMRTAGVPKTGGVHREPSETTEEMGVQKHNQQTCRSIRINCEAKA